MMTVSFVSTMRSVCFNLCGKDMFPNYRNRNHGKMTFVSDILWCLLWNDAICISSLLCIQDTHIDPQFLSFRWPISSVLNSCRSLHASLLFRKLYNSAIRGKIEASGPSLCFGHTSHDQRLWPFCQQVTSICQWNLFWLRVNNCQGATKLVKQVFWTV